MSSSEKLFEDIKDEPASLFPIGQTPVISIIKGLGYPGNDEGMCAGVTHLWEQAVLCNDEENFKKRSIFINQFYNSYRYGTEGGKWTMEIDLQLNSKGLYSFQDDIKQYTDEFNKLFDKKFSTLLQEKLNGIHTKVKNKAELTLDDKRWLEVESFAEGVELFQNRTKHQDFFGKPLSTIGDKHVFLGAHADEKIFSFTSSRELEKRGGAVQIYDEPSIFEYDAKNPEKQIESIQNYFENLAKILESEKKLGSFAMDLSSSRHRIGLKFNGKDEKGNYLWTICEPNNLPPVTIPHSELGKALRDSLKPKTKDQPDTFLMLKIFTTGNEVNSEPMQNIKMKLNDFYNSHPVTKKMEELNNRNANILSDAAEVFGHLNMLSKLDKKFDIKKDGFNILVENIEQRSSTIVDRIIQSGVEINKRISEGSHSGKTIAHIAAENGDLSSLRVIDKNHGDFSKIKTGLTDLGKTSLDYAKKHHHKDCVDFIKSVNERNALLLKLDKKNNRLTPEEKERVTELKQKIIKDWQSCDTSNKHAAFNPQTWKKAIEDLKKQIIHARVNQANYKNKENQVTHKYKNESQIPRIKTRGC